MPALLVGALGSLAPAVAQELGEQAKQQLRAIYADKASWTPAQRKLDTSLLYASRERRGLAMVQGLAPMRRIADRAHVDPQGMVVVHIRGTVTDTLLRTIAEVGGHVAMALPTPGVIRARVPVRRLEAIAALPEVRSIRPPERFLVNEGSVTSQGDAAHTAAAARSAYSLDGTGVKVGVLSDGADSRAARQPSGDLPPNCAATPGPESCLTVLPGQEGSGDEGTAMMEIVHDLAPGAKLYFAGLSGDPTEEEFAANILALRNTYGCDVIVDDITFLAEGAFQDGVIAQAVNTVKASGALYFSSAGNFGRKDAGTSGTWEGDYVNSGTSLNPVCDPEVPDCWVPWQDKEIHSWNGVSGAGSANSNALTADALYAISLYWSDPLGGAVTDYDLFIFDSTLTYIADGSANTQDCTGVDPANCTTYPDPYEEMGWGAAGERIVVVRWSGPTRAIRLGTFGGVLTYSTEGSTFGHNGGERTISVAATDGRIPGAGNPFVGGATNPVETYSSDGPRRVFYNPDGTAITPGNVLIATSGGRALQKPDITAADCVATAFPTTPAGPYNPFCGTSAAAPHAAAIAALLKSAPSRPGAGQVLASMFTTALDVTPDAGWDRNSGYGIVMAKAAADDLTTNPAADFYTVTPCRVVDTRVAGGALACGIERNITMVGGACGVVSGAKAVSLNVAVTQPSAPGNVRVYAAGAPAPLASNLNYSTGQTRANNAIAPLSAAGQMAVYCSPSGSTHVIVDVNGYFK